MKKMRLGLKIRLAVEIGATLVVALLLGLTILHITMPGFTYGLTGYRTYLISYTGSMEPKLRYNDLVFVQKYDFYKIKEGDIITFEVEKHNTGSFLTVTHKVIGVRTDTSTGRRYLKTQGINIAHPDGGEVTIDGYQHTHRYVGKYAFKSTFLGHATAYLRTPFGLVSMTINLACIGVMLYLLYKPKKPAIITPTEIVVEVPPELHQTVIDMFPENQTEIVVTDEEGDSGCRQ